jgi:urease accessory protein UreF
MSPCPPTEASEVVSPAYQGPNRRHRAAWFSRKERLDDAQAAVAADAESTETLLRRVSLWGGLASAARDRRAEFVATLEALAAKGREGGQPVWPDVVAAVARYVRAVGATGAIDERLLNDALLAAQRARAENDQATPPNEVLRRLDSAARARG